MASSADVDSWKALGGKVDLSADKYVAPTGKQDVKADLAITGHETQQTNVSCIQANVTSLGKTQLGIWKPTWQKSGKRQPRSKIPEPKASSKKAKVQAERPNKPKEAAVKPAGQAKQSRADVDAAKNSREQPKTAAQDTVVGSGRQAAQGVEYKEQAALALPDSRVAVKQEQVANNELAALEHTKTDANGPRRLTDFQLISEHGEKQALESADLDSKPLFITGLVLIATSNAEYLCMKPAPGYKKIFAHLAEQADILYEVCHALHPKHGGEPSAELGEVAAKLSRAKVGKSYASAKEAIIMTGNFLLEQLRRMDTAAGGKATFAFGGTAFVSALTSEVKSLRSHNPNGGISIRERQLEADAEPSQPASAEEKQQQADADYARQLQAKLDAQETRGGNKRAAGKQQVYIKISEAEIADDYPEPTQYEKVDDEMDELVLMDDEMMDLSPEDLPRRVLSDFAVYNSEGFCSSLELLPMWSGVDPDVDLYASGNVLDDDGEWAGGQALNTGMGH
ncbi:hypothetical protein ABBQ38_007247 [Trebouxia sp. C0009 RCD-2024]